MTEQQESQRASQYRVADAGQRRGARSLGARAWEESDGTPQDATDIAERILTSDQKMLDALLPSIIRGWCAAEVARHMAALRKAAFYPPAPLDKTSRGGRLRAAIAHVSLMDFLLPVSGKPIRDATGGECAAAASIYLTTAHDAGLKARWLQGVATAAGNARVGDVLTEADLNRIREEANAH